MIVKEYKILIAYSLTWVPVFHTLETSVNDCTKLKTVESLEPIMFPFTFTLHFFAFSYLSFLTAEGSGRDLVQWEKTDKHQKGK